MQEGEGRERSRPEEGRTRQTREAKEARVREASESPKAVADHRHLRYSYTAQPSAEGGKRRKRRGTSRKGRGSQEAGEEQGKKEGRERDSSRVTVPSQEKITAGVREAGESPMADADNRHLRYVRLAAVRAEGGGGKEKGGPADKGGVRGDREPEGRREEGGEEATQGKVNAGPQGRKEVARAAGEVRGQSRQLTP